MSGAGESASLDRRLNEILILGTLDRGALHGYQIALEIEERSGGYFGFRHGTLYPILHQLEKEGFIDGTWDGEGGGRRRKAYALTPRGRARLRDGVDAWEQLGRRVADFLRPDATVRTGTEADR
jgi:PadR family transcriptional regulator, regulatory protein PadR